MKDVNFEQDSRQKLMIYVIALKPYQSENDIITTFINHTSAEQV